MKKLSGADASFLYAESARMPMHVAALQIYDPATASNGRVGVDDIIDNVRCRAHRIQCFHRRPLETPWRLDHPYWVDDGDFDPARHVFSVELAKPGGWFALCETVAELAAKPLRRDRPLWEMHVVTGLGECDGIPRDAFAVVTKIHHAAVDGVAGIGVTMALHDLEPAGVAAEAPNTPSEPMPGPMSLIANAMLQESLRPMRMYQAWPAIAQMASEPFAPASINLPPRTRFNRRISGRRTFDAVRMPLQGLQRCKVLAHGATVNDVVLTIVGGAMRRYLKNHDELPARTMTAMVPISTRKGISADTEGNEISQMIVELGTDIDDAGGRLQAVRASSAKAKAAAGRIDAKSLAAISALSPAPWLAVAARNMSHSPENIFANTVVTNVKGPPIPFYSCGARLIQGYGMGPLADGLGIFHTALSYCGELTLSVIACAQLLPDIELYTDCLRTEYRLMSVASEKAAARVRNQTVVTPV